MIDLICRKALLKQIPRWLNADNTVARDNLEAMINTQQSVVGRFIDHKRDDGLIDYECSYCGHEYAQELNEGCEKWNYCPICGARVVDECD